MQTAEKFVTDSIEELIKKNAKLERVAELASQLVETYKDSLASYSEIEFAFEKLGETIEEYELFLEGH